MRAMRAMRAGSERRDSRVMHVIDAWCALSWAEIVKGMEPSAMLRSLSANDGEIVGILEHGRVEVSFKFRTRAVLRGTRASVGVGNCSEKPPRRE